MSKFLKLVLVSFAMFSVVFMTGCAGDSIDADDLVGMWEWNREGMWTYTFHEDGTGTRGVLLHDYHEFEWEIVRGELRIECPVAMFGVTSERWRPSIEDNTLTLESLQGGPTYIYTRVD